MQPAPDSLNKIPFKQNELKVGVNKVYRKKKKTIKNFFFFSELAYDLESFILSKPVTLQDKIPQAALQ